MLPARLTLSALALVTALPAQAADPLNVVATVGMIADIARQVGGDCVAVTALIGDGSDPHLYRATPSDVRALQGADLILYGGMNLEGQLSSVLSRLGADRPAVAISEVAVPEAERILAQGDTPDPHVWMDPGLWQATAPAIAAAIAEARPDCAADATARAGAVQAEVQALDSWVAQSVATVPEGQRHLVTAHDAFAYFARAYGLRQTAIQGLSTESEASIADIEAVAATVADEAIPAVFVESTVNPRTVQAMIEAVSARGGSVTIGGELYSDAMGAAGTASGTYIGMVHHNAVTIVSALGGTPAPLPPALHPWADTWGIAK